MKKIFIIIIALIFAVSAGIIYLNRVVLPVKIKGLFVREIEKALQKKAKIDTLQFNIFKGLVIKGLSISDRENEILKIKEAACSFLIWPVFKKNIIIPAITLKSPEIYFQRGSDAIFNLADFLPLPKEQSGAGHKDSGFRLFVYAVQIVDAKINFQDNSLSPAFSKTIDNLDLKMNLSLPVKVKFNGGFNIISDVPAVITVTGGYNITEKQLLAKILIKDLSPKDYSAYFRSSIAEVSQGRIDGLIELSINDKNLNINLDALAKQLKLSKNNISAVFDSNLKVNYQSDIGEDKKPDYSGSAVVNNCKFSGNQLMEAISGLGADIEFNPAGLEWKNLKFKYLNADYSGSGQLSDFSSPRISARLSSADLQLDAGLTVNHDAIKVDNFSGKYIDSNFSLTGDFNLADSSGLYADIKADAAVELSNLAKIIMEFNPHTQADKIALSGLARVNAAVSGSIKDFKSCNINAVISADKLSVYGLKTGDFILNYLQKDSLAEINRMHLSFYDGGLDAAAEINLSLPNYPFETDINIQGVRIEKLKMDTALKERDISGAVSAVMGFNGNIAEFSSLTGAGNILISEGRLWQLDLLKGLGSLFFIKDFTNVVFNRAACDFNIKDKRIFTENIELSSNLCGITGKADIGFDKSINGFLNVRISPEVELSGTVKQIADIIIGSAGKFSEVEISGTLDSPKYKYRPAAGIKDIIGGIKDIFLGK